MTLVRRVFGGALLVLGLFALQATDVSAQEIYDITQLSEKPRIASPMAAQRAIQSAYPKALQAAGTSGKVVLQFVVQSDGRVDGASITVQDAQHPGLAEAAKKAVERIQFVPGVADGNKVATRVVFPISFEAG